MRSGAEFATPMFRGIGGDAERQVEAAAAGRRHVRRGAARAQDDHAITLVERHEHPALAVERMSNGREHSLWVPQAGSATIRSAAEGSPLGYFVTTPLPQLAIQMFVRVRGRALRPVDSPLV